MAVSQAVWLGKKKKNLLPFQLYLGNRIHDDDDDDEDNERGQIQDCH